MANEIQEVEEIKQEATELVAQQANAPVMSKAYSDYMDAYKMAKCYSRSNLVPATYRGNDADCTIAVQIANRMGVDPIFVMQNLYVVKGTPSWSGQACISLIRGCGKFKGARPVYEGEVGTESRKCHFEAIDAETGEKLVGTTIDWKMIKGEGWDKNTKWKNMTEQMMAYRAATFFARVYCPNELQGFRVEGEGEDMNPEPTKAVDIMADAEVVNE